MRCRLVCSLVVVVVDVLGLIPPVEGLTDDSAVENRSSPSAFWSERLQAGPPTAFLRGGVGGFGNRLCAFAVWLAILRAAGHDSFAFHEPPVWFDYYDGIPVARAPSGCAPCFVEGGDRINAACAAALRAGPSAGGCVLVNANDASLNKHCGELTGMGGPRAGISDLEGAFPGFEAAYGAATGVALSSLGRPGVDILEREVPRLLPRPSAILCVEINHWFGGSPPNFRTL